MQVVPDKALLRLAAQRPDLVLELGLRMSQGLKQQLGQLEAIQQVCLCWTWACQQASIYPAVLPWPEARGSTQRSHRPPPQTVV